MLAPRISLKQLLMFMVAVAIYLAIASMAYRGNIVALGLALSIAGLVFVFLVYSISYWILYWLAVLRAGRKSVIVSTTKSGKPVQEASL
jgi:hypothetical protein